jgi:hypothetical protein
MIYRSSVSWSSLFCVCNCNGSRFSAYKPVKNTFYLEKFNRNNWKRVEIKEACDMNWKIRTFPEFAKYNLNVKVFKYFNFKELFD